LGCQSGQNQSFDLAASAKLQQLANASKRSCGPSEGSQDAQNVHKEAVQWRWKCVGGGEGKQEASQKAALLVRSCLHTSSIATACKAHELLEEHHGTFRSKFAEYRGRWGDVGQDQRASVRRNLPAEGKARACQDGAKLCSDFTSSLSLTTVMAMSMRGISLQRFAQTLRSGR